MVLSTWPKPAGLTVFPRHDDPGSDCVLARLLAAEPERGAVGWPAGFEGGIAHRLDTATSGAVAVASDPEQLAWLRELFGRRRLRKVYRFVAARDVSWDTNRCALPVAHDRRRKGRMIVQRGRATPHRGRWLPAVTQLLRLDGSLWEATMRTGVMHQIRVHAAFVGLPLRGDRAYGGGAATPSQPGFQLHHMGFEGPGVRTAPVPTPAWAVSGNSLD